MLATSTTPTKTPSISSVVPSLPARSRLRPARMSHNMSPPRPAYQMILPATAPALVAITITNLANPRIYGAISTTAPTKAMIAPRYERYRR